MRIFFDNNGFIREAITKETFYEDAPGFTSAIVNYTFNQLIDVICGLPLYKYVDSQVTEITDPYDYHVDSKLWNAYLEKLHQEIKISLNTKTLDEMKTIYDSSPQYKKDVIVEEIELKWASVNKPIQIQFGCRVLNTSVFRNFVY